MRSLIKVGIVTVMSSIKKWGKKDEDGAPHRSHRYEASYTLIHFEMGTKNARRPKIN